MDLQQRFSGNGVKGPELLLELGRWTISYTGVMTLVVPAGAEQLREQDRRYIMSQAVAHLLTVTLRGTALFAMQRLVHATREKEVWPEDIPGMVYKWCFPQHTALDAAEAALQAISLGNGVAHFEQALYTCMMVKSDMDLGQTPSFSSAQYREMMTIVRRVSRRTPCEKSLDWIDMSATHSQGRVPPKEMVQRYFDVLMGHEATHGEHAFRRETAGYRGGWQPYGHGNGSRGEGRDDSPGPRQQRHRDLDEESTISHTGRNRLHAMTGGDGPRRPPGNPGQDWRTSPDTGSQRLKGPPPEGAPPDCRTLMEFFMQDKRCFWCTEQGHGRRDCPERRKERTRQLGN